MKPRAATAAALCLALATAAGAQAFTKEDSGWVPLFNGKNFDGLYSRMYDQPVTTTIDPGFKIAYPGTDSVEISVGNVGGEIGTKRIDYTHYRMRIQYRFEAAGNLNAGFLYAVDETYPRMGGDGTVAKGKWPRSIECQMLQGDGGDAFSIQQVTFDTKTTNGRWDPNGKATKVCEFGCDGRDFGATPDKADYPGPRWNDMEVVVRGSDSAFHYVNNMEVFKIWNIRITDNKAVTQSLWPSGAVGLEAEGAKVHYRRWEIMELPKTGPHFLNRLLLSAPTAQRLAANSVYNIKWRHIGAFKKVSIQYTTGSGWKTIADSVDNTDSYAWTVPADPTETLRLRISGPTYVMPDTSKTDLAIAGTAGVLPGTAERFFQFAGNRIPLTGLTAGTVLDIQDVSGRMVRSLAMDGHAPSWDLRDGKGDRVKPGLYFARLRSPGSHALGMSSQGGFRTLRAWVL